MEETAKPSKTQRKRDVEALQQLGVELVQLNASQLAQIEMPEQLLEAVLEGQRIRDFEGRRRQMQYIGKLMRGIDPAPIRARLEQWNGVSREHTALQHLAEAWRGRLIDEAGALAAFGREYPACDLQKLRSLISSIERDKAAGRTLRNYRELFRAVRDIVARSSGAKSAADTE